MAPLVSIVVDNYNYERFLPEAIDSALAQSYPRTEVIVVDDGSTDGSRAIISAYGDRVRAVLQDNRGQAGAFNSGFAASRGDIVVFLDADDVLLPRAVERAVAALDHADAVKVHWPLMQIDESGRRLGSRQPRRRLPEGDYRDLVVREGPAGHVFPPTSGNAWRRSFLETVLPIPEAPFRKLADTYLLNLAPLAGPVARLSRPQGLYRIHGLNAYAGGTGIEGMRKLLAIYEPLSEAMTAYLARIGRPVDPGCWTEQNRHYAWLTNLVAASEEIASLIPPEETFILVDEDRWGDQWGGPGLVAGRRALPFLEHDGRYWGPPLDDDAAIAELERLRRAGAGFIVFGWSSFWWLEHYGGLSAYLRSRYRCVADGERLLAFDLRAARPAELAHAAPAKEAAC